MTLTGSFERFLYSNFGTNFLKNENPFQKLEYISVEITKIKNATFPYKTALSEANANTNRMESAK